MNLLEEAVIIEIFGVRVYAFGLYVMIGTICGFIAIPVAQSIPLFTIQF